MVDAIVQEVAVKTDSLHDSKRAILDFQRRIKTEFDVFKVDVEKYTIKEKLCIEEKYKCLKKENMIPNMDVLPFIKNNLVELNSSCPNNDVSPFEEVTVKIESTENFNKEISDLQSPIKTEKVEEINLKENFLDTEECDVLTSDVLKQEVAIKTEPADNFDQAFKTDEFGVTNPKIEEVDIKEEFVNEECDSQQQEAVDHSDFRVFEKIKHTTKIYYKCNECNFKRANRYELNRHLKIHRLKKPHKCCKCEYTSLDIRLLRQHLNTHIKPYKCTKCKYRGSCQLYLDVHMKTHDNASYKCSECEYTATQRGTLTKHFNAVHLQLSG